MTFQGGRYFLTILLCSHKNFIPRLAENKYYCEVTQIAIKLSRFYFAWWKRQTMQSAFRVCDVKMKNFSQLDQY